MRARAAGRRGEAERHGGCAAAHLARRASPIASYVWGQPPKVTVGLIPGKDGGTRYTPGLLASRSRAISSGVRLGGADGEGLGDE